MRPLPIRVGVLQRVVHAVAVPVEGLREVGSLNKRVGGEEASDGGVVETGVGVDDVQEVVMLVAGEAATVIGIGDVAELGADGCEGLFQVFCCLFVVAKL